jgi:sugar O-acyltransferase (sialic acid O-acetyltransferase NeuD family)
MNLPKILIIGAGGHAQSCLDIIEENNEYSIAGLIDEPDKLGSSVCGYPIIGSNSDLSSLVSVIKYAFIGVGQIRSPEKRLELFELLKNIGYTLPTIFAKNSYVSKHASIGESCVVMRGAIINAGVRIGSNSIINNKALLDHGVQVGSHCHISTNSTLNGDVSIGDRVFIGSSSVIREGINISANSIVPMGSIVRKNLL